MKFYKYEDFKKYNFELCSKISKLKDYIDEFDCYIAGGCFKDYFNNKNPKDIDLFFKDKIGYEKAIKIVNSSKKYEILKENDYVLNFKNIINNEKLQIIKKYTFKKYIELINHFDFIITKFVMFKERDDFIISYHEKYFDDFFNNELNCTSELLYPLSTYFRMFRYLDYGYMPTEKCKKNILSSIVIQTTKDGYLDDENIRELYCEEIENFIHEIFEMEK